MVRIVFISDMNLDIGERADLLIANGYEKR